MFKENMSYKHFNKAILSSAQQSAMKNNQSNTGWFHPSKSTLTPVLAARNSILHSIRADQHPPSQETILNLKTLQQEVGELIEIAKAIWSRHLAETIHNMLFNPKGAWGNIRIICKGEKYHHKSPKLIQMRLPLGDLAETYEYNAKVFAKHFGKVLNNKKSIHNNVLNKIDSCEVMYKLDVPPSWKEFTKAVNNLTNDQDSGLNGVPPNAFKDMSPKNLKVHFNFILEFCYDNLDFEEWNEEQVVPVPKSGGLLYPNKWRGVNLMDIGSKIVLVVFCEKYCLASLKNRVLNISLDPHLALYAKMGCLQ